MTRTNNIPPKLLHKHLSDDVLLENPRCVLPVEIRGELQSSPERSQARLLSRFYHRTTPTTYTLAYPAPQQNLVGLPFTPSRDPGAQMAGKGTPHQVIAQMLESRRVDLPAAFVLQDEEIREFLAHHGVERRSTSFTLVNRADHYFFYRKPHEHVPGTMLLEAARQSTYYQLYESSGYSLGEVTVSLREFKAKFHSYGELMYPIEIVVDDLTESVSPRPRHISYLASFYQKGALIAEVETQAPVIPLEKFKLARNALFSAKEKFKPLPSAPLLTLVATAPDNLEIVQLREIGVNYCVTAPSKVSDAQHGSLSVIFDGSINFVAPISRESSNQTETTWRFGKLTYAQLESLKEIIKRGFVSIGEQGPIRNFVCEAYHED